MTKEKVKGPSKDEGTKTLRLWIDGSHSHTGKGRWKECQIDESIADIVEALQNAGINMFGSCSGHGERPGEIPLTDGRVLKVYFPGEGENK